MAMSQNVLQHFLDQKSFLEGYTEVEDILGGLLDVEEFLEVHLDVRDELKQLSAVPLNDNGPWSVVGMRTTFIECLEKLKQQNNHPVVFGNNCKKTMLKMFAFFMKMLPDEYELLPTIRIIEVRSIQCYINGLRNTELKTNIRLEDPKTLKKAIEFVRLEYERLNQYHLARASTLRPTNDECSYCTGHVNHYYDCPLAGL